MRTEDERIESFKKLWLKEHGEELTNAQALEYSNNLLGFFRALLDVEERIQRWNERLKKEPSGFPVPSHSTYNCLICRTHLKGDEGWYDQYGIKCRLCQKAVENGVIPATVCTDRDSWYSVSDLKTKFEWRYMRVYKKAQIGELIARVVLNEDGHPHHYIFLKTENSFVVT